MSSLIELRILAWGNKGRWTDTRGWERIRRLRRYLLPLLFLTLTGNVAARGEPEPPLAGPGEKIPALRQSTLSSTDPIWAAGPEVPEALLEGIGYLGRFRESWDTTLLLKPESSRFFMYLRGGIPRDRLAANPDLAKTFLLEDLLAGRMIRERAGRFQPAFPVVEGSARPFFQETVDRAAHDIYPRLRSHLKRIRKLAAKSEKLPWAQTLVWSEVLGSRGAEEALARVGALDPARLRNEGYLWSLAPGDPYFTGVERYGSGSWTLHYAWSNLALPKPVIKNIRVRQTLLDRAVDGERWDLARAEEQVEDLGLLDPESRVVIPVLARDDKLLISLRRASAVYAERLLEELDIAPLAERLKVDSDEAFAMVFVSVGATILRFADEEGVISRTPYLASNRAPLQDLFTTLVVTQDHAQDPLEHAYYLYDRQQYDASIREAERFLISHPGDAEGLLRKGMALMKMRRYEDALTTFESSIATPAPPEDIWRGWMLIRAGNILDLLKRREEALEYYRQALDYSSVVGSHSFARQWLETSFVE